MGLAPLAAQALAEQKQLSDEFWKGYAQPVEDGVITSVSDGITYVWAFIKKRDQELAKEFRRLAAKEKAKAQNRHYLPVKTDAAIRAQVWKQAAQMLEERLNG